MTAQNKNNKIHSKDIVRVFHLFCIPDCCATLLNPYYVTTHLQIKSTCAFPSIFCKILRPCTMNAKLQFNMQLQSQIKCAFLCVFFQMVLSTQNHSILLAFNFFHFLNFSHSWYKKLLPTPTFF